MKTMTPDQRNRLYPIGTPVRYWNVMGRDDFVDTVTRSQAWYVGTTAVVAIEGRRGGCAISHMAPLLTPPADAV